MSFSAAMVASALMLHPALAASPDRDTHLEAAARLIPSNADAAIIIPSLKVLSDQLTQSLEGMDRANLLIGSRPIDQIKAAVGFNVGIDDLGAMIAVAMHGEQGGSKIVFVVPVNDVDAFLVGNFAARTEERVTLASGDELYFKQLSAHVALSSDQATIRAYEPGDGKSALPMLLDQALGSPIGRGEIILVVKEGPAALRLLGDQRRIPTVLLRTLESCGNPFVESADGAIVSIDFDALGLIIRSWVRERDGVKPDSGEAKIEPAHSLDRLPAKPYYGAASVDLRGSWTDSAKQWMRMFASQIDDEVWLADVDSIQWAAYPGPAGAAAGLLNDAVVILRTSKPEQVRQAIRQRFSPMNDAAGTPACTVHWRDQVDVGDSLGAADAYEVQFAGASREESPTHRMIRQALFGRVGWRGYVKSISDSVIITFSQRPAALSSALRAAQSGENTLHSNAAIRTMRRMLPAGSFVEGYISVSTLATTARDLAAALGIQDMMPRIDDPLPSIGVGVAARSGAFEAAIVIPSAVAAAALDEFMRRRAGAAIIVAE